MLTGKADKNKKNSARDNLLHCHMAICYCADMYRETHQLHHDQCLDYETNLLKVWYVLGHTQLQKNEHAY